MAVVHPVALHLDRPRCRGSGRRRREFLADKVWLLGPGPSMTAMNPNQTPVHEMRADDVSFTEEARRIRGRAPDSRTPVVRLGQIVFFAAESRDARMLDAEDGCAVCL